MYIRFTENEIKKSILIFLKICDADALVRLCNYDSQEIADCIKEFNLVKNNRAKLNMLINRIYNDVDDEYICDENFENIKLYTIKRKKH